MGERLEPTALSQAAPDVLSPFLGLMPHRPLPEQLFACTGLSGRGHIWASWGRAQPCWGDFPAGSGCGSVTGENGQLQFGSAFQPLRFGSWGPGPAPGRPPYLREAG